MTIHENLRKARLDRAMTQEQVAQQLGVTRQALSSHESGRTQPDIDTLMRLSSIYDLPLEVLVGTQEIPQEIPRSLKITATVIPLLFSLLTLVGSCCLWYANRFFPIREGQLSPEDLSVFAQRQKLIQIWEGSEHLLLFASIPACLLLLLLLLRTKPTLSLRKYLPYFFILPASLIGFPLLFGCLDPVFALTNYIVTPFIVLCRMAVCLALIWAIQLLRKRK